MRRIKIFFALIVPLTLLTACSSAPGKRYLRDKGQDYLHEVMTPPLKSPQGGKTVPYVDFMPVPSLPSGNRHKPQSDNIPRTAMRIVDGEGISYTITQGYGPQTGPQTLLIEQPAATVFADMLNFWADLKIPVSEQNPLEHRLTTAPLKAGSADKESGIVALTADPTAALQISCEVRALGSDTSQVKVQLTRKKNGNDSPTAEQNPALVESVLQNIIYFLVARASRAQEVLASEQLTIGEQSTLVNNGTGQPVLRIEQGFAPSWHAVESALQSLAIEVTDKNRSLGLFYVKINDSDVLTPVDQGSWLGGLFQGSDNRKDDKSSYLVRVQSSAKATQVTLEDNRGLLPPGTLSRTFLQRLREQLGADREPNRDKQP